jgi:hypothetical protein
VVPPKRVKLYADGCDTQALVHGPRYFSFEGILNWNIAQMFPGRSIPGRAVRVDVISRRRPRNMRNSPAARPAVQARVGKTWLGERPPGPPPVAFPGFHRESPAALLAKMLARSHLSQHAGSRRRPSRRRPGSPGRSAGLGWKPGSPTRSAGWGGIRVRRDRSGATVTCIRSVSGGGLMAARARLAAVPAAARGGGSIASRGGFP